MAGIYLHIPFCRKKCTYCDFHFSTTFEPYRDKMIRSLEKEIELRKDYLDDQTIETIYFGGGTPSVLNEDELVRLLNKIRTLFKVSANVEVTLEANPDDFTQEKVMEWKKAGVNRLSIGIQSFREKDLQWMNRSHNVEQSYEAVKMAQSAGITNITIDLIYGLPEMMMKEWEEQVETAVKLGVNHISAYCLTVEQNTALHHFVNRGTIIPAGEDQQADEFRKLVEILKDKGFEQYEISNFAIPGFESRHNSAYWKGINYLGIGPSAHSFNGVSRMWNVANNQRYLKGVEGGLPENEIEELTHEDRFNELLLTGLRTVYGVELNRLIGILTPEEAFYKTLHDYEKSGDIEIVDEVIYLTKQGRLIADRIAADLFIVE